MTDKARLQNRLEKLAAFGVAGPRGRLLDLAGPGGALGAVLREIDETALPQRLIFQSSTTRLLTCEASGRRIITADAPSQSVAGAVLPDDPAGLDALKAAIETGFAGAAPVFVNGATIDQAGSLGDSGVSASALAEAWGIPIGGETATPPPLAAILDAVGGLATAWVRVGHEGTTGRGGDPGHSAELETLAASGLGDETASPSETGFLALGEHKGAQRSVVRITGAEGILWLMAATRDVAKIAGIWQRLRSN